MWARVSLVSPARPGLCWCQDAGVLSALWLGLWWASAALLLGLAPGQGSVTGHKPTRLPRTILDEKNRYSYIHRRVHSWPSV